MSAGWASCRAGAAPARYHSRPYAPSAQTQVRAGDRPARRRHRAQRLGGTDTNGSLSLWTEVPPPGLGPPPHYHLNEDELFLVQQGRVEFLVKGKWVEPGEGATVYIPRGNVHTFRNAGATPSR